MILAVFMSLACLNQVKSAKLMSWQFLETSKRELQATLYRVHTGFACFGSGLDRK